MPQDAPGRRGADSRGSGRTARRGGRGPRNPVARSCERARAVGERGPAAPGTSMPREVEDAPTGHAGTVIVGLDVRIKAQPRRFNPLPQQALRRQHSEIPIHRRETHPREPSTDALEDDGRRGVGVRGANHVEDDPPRHRRAQAVRSERGLRREQGTGEVGASRNHSLKLQANKSESRQRRRRCQRRPALTAARPRAHHRAQQRRVRPREGAR